MIKLRVCSENSVERCAREKLRAAGGHGLRGLRGSWVGSLMRHIMGRGRLAADPLSALVRWQIRVMHNERDVIQCT